jgi:hypothetical protein
MAQKSEQDESNYELTQKIAHSREHMARDLSGLRYELDFPMKFRRSFQRSTVVWIGAAAVVGIVFAFMPGRTKKKISRGWIYGRRGETGGHFAQTDRGRLPDEKNERSGQQTQFGKKLVIVFYVYANTRTA